MMLHISSMTYNIIEVWTTNAIRLLNAARIFGNYNGLYFLLVFISHFPFSAYLFFLFDDELVFSKILLALQKYPPFTFFLLQSTTRSYQSSARLVCIRILVTVKFLYNTV